MDTSKVCSCVPCSWINPFLHSQAERYKRHFCDVYGRAIRSEADFRKNLAEVLERPEIILIWSFCAHRAAILSLCREYGVNVVWWEDGFLPHYYTLHFDPLGFCWESSLPRMIFRKCTDEQRERANFARRMWQIKPNKELPSSITKPYVLWPLQIIGRMVNEGEL